MKKLILLFFFILIQLNAFSQTNYAQLVNPFIGTGGHGHTFPGATLPFGMVQLSPDTRIDGSWDGCSGYHYSDSLIYGFSHTHLSGTGVSDYGDIMLMPMLQPTFDKEKYSTKFSHANESAHAGYYEVQLDNGIQVALTTTQRVGFHRYVFPKGKASIILDLTHRDLLLEGDITQINTNQLAVKRISRAWAEEQHAYALIHFSSDFKAEYNQERNKVILHFNKMPKNRELLVKVGFSMVSTEGAKMNLDAEVPHWDFEKVKQAAEQAWNSELAKIEVRDKDQDKLRTFYTALYHTMIHPNTATDVDGQYRGMDMKIHQADGMEYYTVFSLWDTFRGLHPLFTIIDRQRSLDFIKTFLLMYQQGGRLPVWELAANETDCMIAYHSVSVMADAIAKGITDFDIPLALEAMQRSATWSHLGLPAYMRHGHLAIEHEHESVSKTLEYAYDDWCIAQVANYLDEKEVYEQYMQRSQYWKNLLDPETKLMRPRLNGGWLDPFDPKEVNNHFTEGNSWQYSFFVPQDIYGMIEFMGGAEMFEAKLDELFTTQSATTGRHQVDITGLIGQYAHGNEPSHHMAYLYQYVGAPHKGQQRISQIMDEFYTTQPDGLIGNEDCGQMSAWYVLSAMGFYSVTPGTDYFIIGTPHLEEVSIKLENGNTFAIKANNLSKENKYVQEIRLNGKRKENESYLSYEEIMQGGIIEYDMVDSPKIGSKAQLPPTEKVIRPLVTVPVIEAESRAFKDEMQISIKAAYGNPTLFYSIDKGVSNVQPIAYSGPFILTETATVNAFAVEDGKRSHILSGNFFKKPNNFSVQLLSTYNPQYSAGGPEGLIDGIRGSVNWRKGDWQGYQAQDFEAVVDMNELREINLVGVGFLHESRSWIVLPPEVEISVSTDGENYQMIGFGAVPVDALDFNISTVEHKYNIPESTGKVRYIKVKAKNYGKLPKGHQGENYDAFIFVDEIWVE